MSDMDSTASESADIPEGVAEAFAAVDAINQRPTKEQAKAEKEKAKMEPKFAKEIKKIFEEGEKPAGDDVAKHQEKLIELTRWGAHPRFEVYLKEQGFTLTGPALKKKTLGELDEIHDRMKVCLGARNQSHWMTEMTLLGVKGLEDYTAQSPYLQARHIDISVVSAELRQNDVFLDTIAQLEMDYSSYTSWGPEVRLLMYVSGVMYNVVRANMASKLTQQISAAALEALNNPQPAAERSKPIIPGQNGAAAEDPIDRPMPSAPTAPVTSA